MKGKKSLNVKISLVSRLLEDYPSEVQLCRSCRAEFVSQRDTNREKSSGTNTFCDFCESKIDSSIRKSVKGPLGEVMSWSGKTGRRGGKNGREAYEYLDVCLECQQAFVEFVEDKE